MDDFRIVRLFSSKLKIITRQSKKYDDDEYPVFNFKYIPKVRLEINKIDELISLFIKSDLFIEIVNILSSMSNRITFVVPGVLRDTGVIVLGIQNKISSDISCKYVSQFNVEIVFVKAEYEKYACPSRDSHLDLKPGCEIGYYNRGRVTDPVDFGSVGFFVLKDSCKHLVTCGHIFTEYLENQVTHKPSYYLLKDIAKKHCKFSPTTIGTIFDMQDTICTIKNIQLDYCFVKLDDNVEISNKFNILENYNVAGMDLKPFLHEEEFGYYIVCRSSDTPKYLDFHSRIYLFEGDGHKPTKEIGFLVDRKNAPQPGDSGSPVVRYLKNVPESQHEIIGIFLGVSEKIAIMIQLCHIPGIETYQFYRQ